MRYGCSVSLVVIAVVTAACGNPFRAGDAGAAGSAGGVTGVQDDPAMSEECSKLLGQVREIRVGKQPCSSQGDCTVWHNGEYWDGCPPEVNKDSAAKLDELRAEVEKLGCPVERNANCAPQAIRGCVNGECGGYPPFVMHLTPEQKKVRDEAIRKADEAAASKGASVDGGSKK